MFSILRFILIVGAIFYYSPVRQRSDMPASVEALPGRGTTEAADRLETVWQALPESARQAVLDRILATGGSGAASKATDTLQPGDRHPAYRPDGNKPRI
jgi:hypothetical protein